ncbi:MAG TPA: alpha/beta family hydrolase [Micromonosporaceae bacterium]
MGRGDRSPGTAHAPPAGDTSQEAGASTARFDLDTSWGPARVDLDRPDGTPASLLVLGHGAGGGVDAPDLLAVRDLATSVGVVVARVTQPYRVAGRRAPAPAHQLDAAWSSVVSTLVAQTGGPALVVGGRSSGARVACRTAAGLGAVGIVTLAFPLHPPGRRTGGDPALAQARRSRADELDTGLPTLVVNGDRDPFGIPAPAPDRQVAVRPGERHDLRRDPGGVAAIVVDWLRAHGWAR